MIKKQYITPVKRIFIPGDRWVYYKLYCGARTSDLLLVQTIKPLVDVFLTNGWINTWHFIRFTDPDFHLRIRFYLSDLQFLGNIIQALMLAVKEDIDQNIIYKIQIDTYIRELERYGAKNIENAETLFFYESTLITKAINFTAEDPELHFFFVLKSIDTILNAFRLPLHHKLALAISNSNAYNKEFNRDKKLTKQLDKKYRKHKDVIHSFMSNQHQEANSLFQLLLSWKHEMISVLPQTFTFLDNTSLITKDELISSHIHMLVNRAFRSNQRFYELVCYDFLIKYYKFLVMK